MSDLRMIDLCSGIGGMHLAGSAAGFRTVFAADVDADARRVYEANLGLRPHGDLAGVDPRGVPGHDLAVAGMPCQPWSSAGDLGGLDDTRSHVLIHVLRILARKRPAAVLWENVAPLATADGRRPLRLLVECLRGLGYRVSWRVLRASQFGGAQMRERLFVVGSRAGKKFDFDGVRTTGPGRIGDFLNPAVDGGWLRPERYAPLPRPRVSRSGLAYSGHVHGRMRKPGGDPLVQWNHDSYYHVFSPSGIGPTITTKSNTRYLVDVGGRVRRITVDEVRSLMGFPAWFRFEGPGGVTHRQLGNSVYVPCVAAVMRAVAAQVFGVQQEPPAAPASTMARPALEGETT